MQVLLDRLYKPIRLLTIWINVRDGALHAFILRKHPMLQFFISLDIYKAINKKRVR